MKLTRLLAFVLAIGTLGLSACGAIATTPIVASETAGALPVAFIGIVDSIAGDQWVISGTTVTVDPDVVQDGPFAVGDQVKVEGIVNNDSSFTVTRVEDPTPQDVSTLSPFGNDNTNDANINDANTNDGNANINDTNTNDDNSNGDSSNDGNTNDNNGGGNSNDGNSNDDNGSNSNDGNSNDDNGGNSNDDNSNDDNGGNSNDDKDNDDNSGKGGGDDDKDDNSNED